MNANADLAEAVEANLLDGAGRHDEVVLDARERAGKLHAYGHGAAHHDKKAADEDAVPPLANVLEPGSVTQ